MAYEELKDIISDEERIIFGEDIPFEFLSDGLKREHGVAEILVFPNSTEEVSKILEFAYKENIPVTPRGAGTGLVGGTIPTEGGIVLDLSRLSKIIDLDEDSLTIEVEAGVLLKDIQSYVEERGLFYPPDPGEKNATIGGNISTNAGGMRAVKYGVTRDYVRQLEVVKSDGTILTLGSRTIKNSTGLDIKDLIIGSEGTLGVITKALLKLIPKPSKSISCIVAYKSLKDGVDSVVKIIKENVNPTAIEFIERDVIKISEKYLDLRFPCELGEAFLLLTFDGEESEIKTNYEKTKELVLNNGALDFILLDNSEIIDRTWKLRGALVIAVESISEEEPIDIVVPIVKIADFIEYTKIVEGKYGIQVVSFGHAGDGNIHLCVVRNGMEESLWREKSYELLKDLYKKSNEYLGLPSGEHGIGINKKEYFKNVTKADNIDLMRGIKNIFDNKGILNRNKVYN